MKEMIKGSLVALVTPMNKNGEVNFDALKNLVEFHVQSGTSAIVSVGTTGESATLNFNEQIEVVKKTLEYAAGRVPVIAGCGANSTSHSIELCKALEDTGVVAGLNVTPYYNKPTQEGLYLHYKAIAEATHLDQILYNVPGRTAVDMLPETVARLSKIKNIVGIKEATGDLQRLADIKALVSEDFAVYSGDDATATDFILQGGHGAISVTTNVAPVQMKLMCDFALIGDATNAHKANEQLIPVHKNLFVEANPIPVKWACADLGLIPSDDIRLPLTKLSAKFHEIVSNSLIEAKLK